MTMAEEVKHTPGPWFATPTSGPFGHVSSRPAKYENDGGDICTTWKNADANTRLIAAAPDLLEAAKRAVREAVADQQDEWFAALDAAIAKAEGRS
jgi:hypothetical protein